jgi:hypothetical protein
VPERVAPEDWRIVHDVVPVGSPVEDERYDAVTEPWMSNPPLRAKSPVGQLTVNCLSPEAVPPETVMMDEPSRPAAPAGP